ncbi:MAG: hypothetical protein ACI8TX_003905 [Hyphomicrobiaceae bacterium]
MDDMDGLVREAINEAKHGLVSKKLQSEIDLFYSRMWCASGQV